MASEKRFHFVWTPAMFWICRDKMTGATGLGSTPTKAFDDCMLDLEMHTSDIHQ